MKYNLLFIVLMLMFGLVSEAQAGSRIKCPVNKVRTEITTPLPPGWWQTPQVGHLQGTRIANIGGKQTLVCKYRAYGTTVSVMIEKPGWATKCRGDKTGFNCQGRSSRPQPVTRPSQQPSVSGQARLASPASGAKLYRSGSLSIKQTYMADLDRGRVTSDSTADIWFQAKTAKDRYITPRNGAQIALAGKRAQGRAGCARMRLSNRRVSLRHATPGNYLCVRTNAGRYSEIRINSIGRSPGKLNIKYHTWQ